MPEAGHAQDVHAATFEQAYSFEKSFIGVGQVGPESDKDWRHIFKSFFTWRPILAFYPDERIAIFIDGANLYSTLKNLDYDIDYKQMLTLFKEKGRLICANYYTALREHDDYSPIKPLMDWLDYNGYHVITKPAKTYTDRDGRSRTKGNMDIEIVVDMIELAPHIDHILLFTGDGDFAAAVKAVQKRGTRVTVLSSMTTKPSMLSDELRRQADAVIELSEMGKLIGRPKREYTTYEDDDDL